MKKIGAILLLIGLAVAAYVPMANATPAGDKVAICHRTAADTNPYVYLEVDAAAAPAHIGNTLPGHKATDWKSDGTFRGVAHLKGAAKDDYLAFSTSDCDDFVPTTTPPPPPPTTTPPPPPTTTPPPPPTDVCPNLEGNQAEVPEGYELDDGECVLTPTETPPPPVEKKAYVCKYVGTPGVDETLQTGQNPIEVSVNALPGFLGDFPFAFADAQGHSVAIGYVGDGYPELTVEDCPPITPPPPPRDVCPNLEGNQGEVPEGYVLDDEGQCVIPPPPPTDVCPNIEGNQEKVPDGYVLDNEGQCVPVVVTTTPPPPPPTTVPPPPPTTVPPTTPPPTPPPTTVPPVPPKDAPECKGNGADRPKCQPLVPVKSGPSGLAFTGASNTTVPLALLALFLLVVGVALIRAGRKTASVQQ